MNGYQDRRGNCKEERSFVNLRHDDDARTYH